MRFEFLLRILKDRYQSTDVSPFAIHDNRSIIKCKEQKREKREKRGPEKLRSFGTIPLGLVYQSPFPKFGGCS